MEWQIVNGEGLGGQFNSLGADVDGKYEIFYECAESLQELLEQLLEDDSIKRSVRQQLAVAKIAQKDLVPILLHVEDDPEVFRHAVRLLVNLTQPLEVLSGQQDGESPWFSDVEKMLTDVKAACANIKFLGAIFKEITNILEDGQGDDYDLLESDCDTINQSLLLIRNLLHIQDSPGSGNLSGTHMLLLKCLFQCGIDKILLDLLNRRQKDYWGVAVVQLISLLYKDLVSEIFQRLEDCSSCGEESCDSSNCSQCEAAMDRQYLGNTGSDRSAKSRFRRDSRSSPISLCEGTVTFSCSGETETLVPNPSNFGNERCFENEANTDSENEKTGGKAMSTTFQNSCCVSKKEAKEREQYHSCKPMSEGSENQTLSSVSPPTVSPSELEECFKCNSETGTTDMLEVTMEELGLRITDFTTQFLQKGFSSLVQVLQDVLLNKSSKNSDLDDSYFLWSVAFFLKFARRKEIEFKNIRDVFTTDVFGFLVYEAISNGESVLIAHKNKQTCSLTMRRLHLSVCALRELFKTMSFHRDRGLNKEDTTFLEQLQKNLANMTDLRQVFLWLVRQFKPGCHSSLFLRDVIVTNHYFLLLFEEWIGKEFVLRKELDMLDHVKQFATEKVMQQYGHLLQNFIRNDHHVNNCVFTMMHHVAGDCLKPDALLQVNILKTFIEIWDRDFPITKEMNDLMEYVIHRFLSTAEDNPLSCAIQLFMGLGGGNSANDDEKVPANSDEEESNWTEEEEDKLVMWYNELEGQSDMVEKLSVKFCDQGINKSKLEIVNHLYKLGWLTSEELEKFITLSESDCKGPIQGLLTSAESDKTTADLVILGELNQLPSEEVIPHCVKKLQNLGEERQLQFIQRNLLEVAYCKLDGDFVTKKHLEEPIHKYYTEKNTDAPLIYYNDEEEEYRDNMYFMVILEQLGVFVEEVTGLLYPRIPAEWSVVDLLEKAKLLGEIKTDEVKFDLSTVDKAVDSTYSQTKSGLTKISHDNQAKKVRLGSSMPNTMWMNYIGQYNTHGLEQSVGGKSAIMDTST